MPPSLSLSANYSPYHLRYIRKLGKPQLLGDRAIHDSHSPVGFGRLSRQKAHKLRAHGSNSSVGNGSTRIQVWISDHTQVPAGHGSPAINIAIVHSSRHQNLAHPAN